MSTAVKLRRNPVGNVRDQAGLTLASAAKEAGVNLQAFFLQEQGTYPDLLPAIETWLLGRGVSLVQVSETYHLWQRDKRMMWGEELELALYEWDEPSGEHPFIQFRISLNLSRMAFAKHFCVHTSSLYRLEHLQTNELPHQLVDALRQAGLNGPALSELIYRVRETDVLKR